MSTLSPPAVTTGAEGGKSKKVRVKKESTGEEGEKDKPYKCNICVKRYARRDYLERHLLNRMSNCHYSLMFPTRLIIEISDECREKEKGYREG